MDLKAIARVGLLFALALNCTPCSKTALQLAQIIDPSTSLTLLFSLLILAFVCTLVLAVWVGLSMTLKVWID
jgi:hypothetical protein